MAKYQLKDIDKPLLKRVEDAIAFRLKNTLSIYEVLDWLSNFKLAELDFAIQILERVEVYSDKELFELWDDRLKTLLGHFDPATSFFVHPVEEFGKSGTLMVYYFRKTKTYINNQKRFTFFESSTILKKAIKKGELSKNAVFVLIDDFSGSGKSIIDYYNHAIKQQFRVKHSISKFVVITLFSLREADENISKKLSELLHITETKIKAFPKRGSVFGSNMLSVRKFAYGYGVNLFSTTDRNTGKLINHPLGFENSQALIVFPYNPPNNTLPIIWSIENNFHPLFARSPSFKISEAKRIRKELAYNISLLKHSEKENFRSGQKQKGERTISFTSKVDFLNFGILFLKRQRRSKPTICQILGITQSDFDAIIHNLIKANLLDDSENFTEHGDNIYLDVIKKLRLQRENNRIVTNDSVPEENSPYFPENFKGRSKID